MDPYKAAKQAEVIGLVYRNTYDRDGNKERRLQNETLFIFINNIISWGHKTDITNKSTSIRAKPSLMVFVYNKLTDKHRFTSR